MTSPQSTPRTPDEWARNIQASLDPEASEYYLRPLVSRRADGRPAGRVDNGDCLFLALRRGEREVQLTLAFGDDDFPHFPRRRPFPLSLVTLTRYHESLSHVACAFPPAEVAHTLGEVVSQAGLTQLRAAESEKFAHVTRFLNGNRCAPFPGEAHLCIPTPHDLPFEEAPAMASRDLAEAAARHLAAHRPDLAVLNFANGDVVGHTGSRAAKIGAAEAVDRALARVVETGRHLGYALLITADHGVLETGDGPEGHANRSHTLSRVPCILAGRAARPVVEGSARSALCDVAPTVLSLMGLAAPAAMTGTRLFEHDDNPGPVLLVVLDGWGLSDRVDNPVARANTPCLDRLMEEGAFAALSASAEAVGLAPGKPGNSEAGHLNIGAGRVVVQDDVRIAAAVRSGALARNPVLARALEEARSRGGRAHVVGLLSERSSHGTVEEALACLEAASLAHVRPAYLHLILDGRSSLPGSAPAMVRALGERLEALPGASLVTAMGRAFALDRDGDWEGRTRVAYEALVGPS